MMKERWKSDELGSPQLQGIYRIDLSKEVYRRFDLALEMNDTCSVTTSYYGGVPTCSIADDKDPAPWESESCGVCDALRSSFGDLPYGTSSSGGAYGPGLYTYRNPALAHHVMVSGDDQQTQGTNYVLIQCRVIADEISRANAKPFAGFTDNSGVVFCAQSTAVIPTHLLTYRLGTLSNLPQLKLPTNAATPQSGEAVSSQTANLVKSNQTNNFAAGPSMAPRHTGLPPTAESNANVRISQPLPLDQMDYDDDPYADLPAHPPSYFPPPPSSKGRR